MKKFLLLVSFLIVSAQFLLSQNYKTVNVDTPGTLSSLLTSGEKFSVTYITITGSVDSLDLVTLKNMTQLYSIDLSGCSISGNRIPAGVFNFCFFSAIILPSTVTEISHEAFFSCFNLVQITLPSALKKIGYGAFLMCNKLSSVELPDQLEYIDYNAFTLCRGLQNITFPESLKSIGNNAFSLTRIDSFYIPASVTLLSPSSLSADSLTYIEVDESNQNYCSTDGVLFNKNKTELIIYPPFKPETEYTIPSTVNIATIAFCAYLTAVHVPESVIAFTGDPFMYCNKLSLLTVSENNPAFKSTDNVLFNKAQTELLRFAPDQNVTKYVVPDQVHKIHDRAFQLSKKLERIILPVSLDTIGLQTFNQCIALDSLVLPMSLKSIEEQAFANCSSLSAVIIPASVDSVPTDVFIYCSELDAMTIPSTMSYFEYTNLNHNTNIESIKFNAAEPPEVGTFNFYSIDTVNAILYVPEGAGQNYMDHPFWGAFTIEEYSVYLNTANEDTNVTFEGGLGSFTIESNSEWSITTEDDWIHPDTENGMDNGKINFSVDANSGEDRQGTIAINAYSADITIYVTVQQAGVPTVIDKTQLNILNAYSKGDVLFVENAKNLQVDIYTIQGICVLSEKALSDQQEFNISHLPSGIYLVKAGNMKTKIRLSGKSY